MVLGLVCHAGFVGLFWFLGEHQFALLNIGSVALFTLAALLIAKRQMVHVALILGSLELLVHAWVVTEALGWQTGFHHHMLIIIALWFIATEVSLVARGADERLLP